MCPFLHQQENKSDTDQSRPPGRIQQPATPRVPVSVRLNVYSLMWNVMNRGGQNTPDMDNPNRINAEWDQDSLSEFNA